ncbi:MAG: hypothetical protein GXO25_05030 [Euryarchaeota archaeon]|nr:hypothetical protein [Euryarchaeota archaeon]
MGAYPILMLISTVFGLFAFLAIYALPSIYRSIYPWVCERGPNSFDRFSILGWYRNWDYRMASYKCLMVRDCFTYRWLIFSSLYGLWMGFLFGITLYVVLLSGHGAEVCFIGFGLLFMASDVILRITGEKYIRRHCKFME